MPEVLSGVEAFTAWQAAKSKMATPDKSFARQPKIFLSFLIMILFSSP